MRPPSPFAKGGIRHSRFDCGRLDGNAGVAADFAQQAHRRHQRQLAPGDEPCCPPAQTDSCGLKKRPIHCGWAVLFRSRATLNHHHLKPVLLTGPPEAVRMSQGRRHGLSPP